MLVLGAGLAAVLVAGAGRLLPLLPVPGWLQQAGGWLAAQPTFSWPASKALAAARWYARFVAAVWAGFGDALERAEVRLLAAEEEERRAAAEEAAEEGMAGVEEGVGGVEMEEGVGGVEVEEGLGAVGGVEGVGAVEVEEGVGGVEEGKGERLGLRQRRGKDRSGVKTGVKTPTVGSGEQAYPYTA